MTSFNSIFELLDHYEEFRHFIIRQCTINNTPNVPIQYLKWHTQGDGNRQIFQAAVNDSTSRYHGRILAVKFTDKYNIEAHQLLASTEPPLAPKIHDIVIHSDCVAIIMDWIQTPILSYAAHTEGDCSVNIRCLPNDTKRFIKNELERALALLHSHNFVHGDLREPNIILEQTPRACSVNIIDFEWCDKIGTARYPQDGINRGQFPWLPKSMANQIIKPEHDIAAIQYYIENELGLEE